MSDDDGDAASWNFTDEDDSAGDCSQRRNDRESNRKSTSSASSVTATTASASTVENGTKKKEKWIVPIDYFDIRSGLPPGTAEAAVEKLWQIRRNKTAFGPGLIDDKPHPGAGDELLNEAKGIKASLEKWVLEAFWEGCIAQGKGCGLRMPDTHDELKVKEDVCTALSALKSQDDGSVLKAYLTVIRWHHQRAWLKGVVKAWLEENNMEVAKPQKQEKTEGKGKTRSHGDPLGGFATCARNVKNAQVRKINRTMMGSVGWCVAARTGKKDEKEKDYTKMELTMPSTSHKETVCLVTYKKDAKVSTLKWRRVI